MYAHWKFNLYGVFFTEEKIRIIINNILNDFDVI